MMGITFTLNDYRVVAASLHKEEKRLGRKGVIWYEALRNPISSPSLLSSTQLFSGSDACLPRTHFSPSAPSNKSVEKWKVLVSLGTIFTMVGSEQTIITIATVVMSDKAE